MHVAHSGNDADTAFDNFVWRLWESAKDYPVPAERESGLDTPEGCIGRILLNARSNFSAAEQHDALLAAEELGRSIVAGLEDDLVRARKALAALQIGPAEIMRQQIGQAQDPT